MLKNSLLCLFFLVSWIQGNSQLMKKEIFRKDLRSIRSKVLEEHKMDFALINESLGEYVVKENNLLEGVGSNIQNQVKSFDLIDQTGSIAGKMVLSPKQVYVHLQTEKGLINLYPVDGKNKYEIEWGFHGVSETECKLVQPEKKMASVEYRSDIGLYSYGDDLQSFRLAVICTGEFYQNFGNNDIGVQAAISHAFNGLNLIYERDLSLNFTLGGRTFFYKDPDTDPFTPNLQNATVARVDQSAAAFEANFDDGAYDVGITLNVLSDGWSGGGEAMLGATCNAGSNNFGPMKARAWASSSTGMADNGFTQIVAHEIGHCFNATHTHNSGTDLCLDAVNSSSAYEMGSGNTIMAYGGACGGGEDYVEAGKTIDNYFHFSNLYQIAEYVKTQTCQNILSTLNTPPEIEINPCKISNFQIPKGTPFRIEALATDAEDQNLTYVWEQLDEDGLGKPNVGFLGLDAANSTTGPLFRGYPPSSNPERIFPRAFNYFLIDPFEPLPLVPRDIHLRCTVRDNNSEGGIFTSDELKIEVLDVGPLEIEIDSLIDTIVGGETITISWEDAGISTICENVKISLISLTDPNIIIDITESIPFAQGSIEYFIAPGIAAEGNFNFKVECDPNPCFSFFSFSRPFFISDNCPNPDPYFICDVNNILAEKGDESLDLNVSAFPSMDTYSAEVNLTEGDDVIHFIREDLEGECEALFFESGTPVGAFAEFYPFRVSEGGTFRFRNTKDFAGFYILDAARFDVTDLCSSYIAGSVRESQNFPGTLTTGFSSRIDVILESCTEYILGITSVGQGGSYGIDITGDAPIYVGAEPMINGPILFVIEEDETIVDILNVPDLRNFRQGNYEIYGIQVEAETFDPELYIGGELSDLVLGGICLSRSQNTGSIEIINSLPDEDMDGYHTDEDCDDSNSEINPEATEIPNNDIDEDCDGIALMIDEDMDGFNSDEDCDDSNPNINPGMEEIPNNEVDENCDGEALVIDEDMDGFNSDEDCDDNNADINPNAEEIPNNGVDENCDGIILNFDGDGDGFNSEDDCDDLNADINPAAEEIPNNDIDEDCDGEALIIDEDMDGFNSDEDCDDLNAAINPDAMEVPNNDIDEDCDGEALIIDEDMDGFNSDEDCDDLNADINPDAMEVPNNDIDEDCDGEALIIDEDMDGFNSDEDCDDLNADINPDAEEIANNGIDENCDGEDLVSSTNEFNQSEITIYPNPVKDILYLQLNSNRSFSLKIQNVNGQILTSVQNRHEIPVYNLSQGVYLVVLEFKGDPGLIVEKIAVIK